MSRTHLRGWDYVTTPFTLDDGDALRLDAGITLAIQDFGAAVMLTGGRARIHNAGEISTYGVHSVEGTLTGPFDIRIVNQGSFDSSGAAIALASAEGATGTLRVVNAGDWLDPTHFAQIHMGIDLSQLHADRVVVINEGGIGGGIFGGTAYAGSFGADIVVNRGSMVGDVLLGAGDDRFRNTGEFFGVIYGGDGDDRIMGGAYNDPIWGGAGRDIMAGGLGGDYYLFASVADSAPDRAHADLIRGFDKADGDVIGLPADADTTVAGDQDFVFIEADAFSGTAGELRCEITQHGAVLYADVDGDAQSDFALVVQGAITQPADLQLVL